MEATHRKRQAFSKCYASMPRLRLLSHSASAWWIVWKVTCCGSAIPHSKAFANWHPSTSLRRASTKLVPSVERLTWASRFALDAVKHTIATKFARRRITQSISSTAWWRRWRCSRRQWVPLVSQRRTPSMSNEFDLSLYFRFTSN